ncbi:2535_t:CDS:2, partial [Gigaspora rosea]
TLKPTQLESKVKEWIQIRGYDVATIIILLVKALILDGTTLQQFSLFGSFIDPEILHSLHQAGLSGYSSTATLFLKTSPTTSATPPLKNEMLYVNENNSDEQQKSSLNVLEQTFDLQNYRETSLESPNLIYAQDPSNDTQIVPISPTNYSDFSSTEDLPTPITVKSMNYQIATPNIPPGFCPFFPPSMYPYIGYPVIPSITLKESPMVPSSDRPPRPKNYNFNDSDCKTQLYES